MAKSYYIIPIFVPHLGCPHDCIFCNQKRISGVERPLESNELHKEIENTLSTLDYTNNPRVEIAFFGGSFTGIEKTLQEKYLEIGYSYIQQGKVHGLRLSTRPDYITDEILERLKKFGVDVIELGVQSMHDDVLMAANRGHNKEDVIRACALIKAYGFTLGIQLMPGLPLDTVERFKISIDEAIKLEPEVMRLYPTLVIKDTELADDFKLMRYKPMTLDDAVRACSYGLEKCLENKIQVIRLGLQPSDTVSTDGDVLAGPFHPTFRQLVEGELFLRWIQMAIDDQLFNNQDENELIITCALKQVSSVSGMNKRNKIALKEAYGFSKIKIVGHKEFKPYTISVEVF